MAYSARKKIASHSRSTRSQTQGLRSFLSVFAKGFFIFNSPFISRKGHLNKTRYRQRHQGRRWLIMILTIILLGFLPFSWWLGYIQNLLKSGEDYLINTTAKLGFKIEEVFIEGRQYTSSLVLSKTIQAYRGQPILIQDLDHLKESLVKIDWIKEIHIQRRLPHHLYIKIIERHPIARWQHQKNLFLVDNEGVVIQNANIDPFQNLPLVVGTDAPIHAPKILTLLEKFPKVRERLSALTRIRQRRWDLTLSESILVKLSEENLEDGLARLSLLIEQGKINPVDVSVVDLRNPKQLVLRLSREAAVRIKLKGKEA
jgi:cell division protein FtsQ